MDVWIMAEAISYGVIVASAIFAACVYLRVIRKAIRRFKKQ